MSTAACGHAAPCECQRNLQLAMERVIAMYRLDPSQSLSAATVCVEAGLKANQRHLIAGNVALRQMWNALKAKAVEKDDAALREKLDREKTQAATIRRLRNQIENYEGIIEGLTRQLSLAVQIINSERGRTRSAEASAEVRHLRPLGQPR